MSKCERSGAPDHACEQEASFTVHYSDGVRLALCEEHTEEVAEEVQNVSAIRTEQTARIEEQLSRLAGAKVRVFRHSPSGGIVLTGAVEPLARICNIHHGRNDKLPMYFRAVTLESMLAAAERAAA